MSPRSFRSRRSAWGGRSRRSAWAGALGATGLVLTWTSVAGAHIHPEPGSVAAGEQVTVGFGVEHGCGDSPTTEVAFSVPAEVTGATGVAKAGWTIDNTAKVVTFTGGELDAHTAETFELAFTAPSAPGDVHFPIVQTCTEGELAWITIAKEGESEPDYPAPVLEVTAPAAGAPTSVAVPAGQASSTTAHAHDDEEGDDHDHDDAEEGATTDNTASPDDAASSEAAAAQDAGDDTGGDDGDGGGSSTLPVVLGVGAGGAALGAVAVIARRKR